MKHHVAPCSLKEARQAAGLAQKRLACLSGVASSTISNYERQVRQPTTAHAVAMARILGHTVEELFPGQALRDAPRAKAHGDDLRQRHPANVLRQVRQAAGLTQRQLADLVDLSVGAIAKYEERLIRPTAKNADAIARVVGLRAERLFPGQALRQGPVLGTDGYRLRAARQKRRISQRSLAQTLHVDQVAISDFELGIRATPAALRQPLAQALGANVDEIWFIPAPPGPQDRPVEIVHSGHAIAIARIERGWSRRQLATASDVSVSAITLWEQTGHAPIIDRASRVLNNLGLVWKLVFNDDPETFPPRSGARLASFRRNAGYTQTSLAYKLGVSNTRVCQLEKGGAEDYWPNMPVLFCRIALIFGVSENELWGESREVPE
jgi:transcriptional regulator with XRE-family HTH domain